MNYRFWRRFRLTKRLYCNVSKRGVSLSYKGKIINITFGRNGIRLSKGIKGSGFSITDYKPYK